MATVLCHREFDPDLVEISAARRLVREVLPTTTDMRADDIILIVSELVSNAVLHARGSFTLTVSCDHARVRVEVTDPNPRLPMVSNASQSALSGRGLLIVQAVTTSWGVWPHPGAGKTVWAEVSTLGWPGPYGDEAAGDGQWDPTRDLRTGPIDPS